MTARPDLVACPPYQWVFDNQKGAINTLGLRAHHHHAFHTHTRYSDYRHSQSLGVSTMLSPKDMCVTSCVPLSTQRTHLRWPSPSTSSRTSLSKRSEREPSHESSSCPEEALQDRASEEQVCEREAENGGLPGRDRVAGHRVPCISEERTNILVNFWVETEDMKQIGEVQFLMQEYLTATGLHRRDPSVLA